MFAATAAGVFPRVEEAMNAMGRGFDMEFQPTASAVAFYEKRFEQYQSLGRFIAKDITS
jgi:L-ribulokinase